MILFVLNMHNKQVNRGRKWISGCPGLEVGVGEMGVTANEYRVSFWSDKNVLVDCDGGCTPL